MISMIGVMQFVVQLAQEMMAGRPPGAFTPWMTVSTPSPFEGADSRTKRAPRANVPLKVLAPREHPGALEDELDT
jgi:hypothetical protein